MLTSINHFLQICTIYPCCVPVDFFLPFPHFRFDKLWVGESICGLQRKGKRKRVAHFRKKRMTLILLSLMWSISSFPFPVPLLFFAAKIYPISHFRVDSILPKVPFLGFSVCQVLFHSLKTERTKSGFFFLGEIFFISIFTAVVTFSEEEKKILCYPSETAGGSLLDTCMQNYI